MPIAPGEAARVSAAGADATTSVSVAIDARGQVMSATVGVGWRRRPGVDGLSAAVVEAVRDAAVRRLAAWRRSFSQSSRRTSQDSAPADRGPVDDGVVGPPVVFDQAEFQRRLLAAATGSMSADDRRAALLELLALAEAVEAGIDEVSAKLTATASWTCTGRSPNGHVTVTMTGGGEVTAVRVDRSWARTAPDAAIGRQLTAAFRAAYDKATVRAVRALIADSPLGEVQRATQDPLGLAGRLRLTD